MIYNSDKNVFEAALERIELVYNTHDDVIVSMSGGKDSAVLLYLAGLVAAKKNRLPVKVFWLDQEAEWQATVDYMTSVMTRPDVKPYWYQIPFDFTNSLSYKENFLRVWDPAAKDKWIHPQHPISIKENPTGENRFKGIINAMPPFMSDGKKIACLVGMRISESISRRTTIMFRKGETDFMGITWCRQAIGNTRVFYPIYDFTDDDIWITIENNNLPYNKIYDYQFRWGCKRREMRVSALIHETAWHSIKMLQEFEPNTYNRFINRVSGVSCFNHFGHDISIKNLPVAFRDWKEYRDYLLVHLVKQEYWELFRRRWEKQNTEQWYRVHVREIMVNDIDGTINSNAGNSIRTAVAKEGGRYANRE